METCSLISHDNKIKRFMNEWIPKLKNDANGRVNEFYSAVLQNFGSNQIELQLIEKQLESLKRDTGVSVSIKSIMKKIHLTQLSDEFQDWGLTDGSSEVGLFGINAKGLNYVKNRFGQSAYKYCVIDPNIPLYGQVQVVTNDRDLQQNITFFKNQLLNEIIDILTSFGIDIDPNLSLPGFDSAYGADYDIYKYVMRKAKSVLAEDGVLLDLKTFDFTAFENSTAATLIYDLIALNNFDYLLGDQMEGLVKINKKIAGDLNNTDYRLETTEDTTIDTVNVVSDLLGKNALNFTKPDIKKIISAIPCVTVQLSKNSKVKKFKYTTDFLTLLPAHILQLGAWMKTYGSRVAQLFMDENQRLNIDFQQDPIGSVYHLLKSLHDYIENWDKYDLRTNRAERNFIQSIPCLNTAMAVYEYLFNEQNRINPNSNSINTLTILNPDLKLNIIYELALLMASNEAPAYIQYEQNGTIVNKDNSELTIKDNYILRAFTDKLFFTFETVILQTLMIKANLLNTDFEDILYNPKEENTSFEEKLKNSEYVKAIASIFHISSELLETFKLLLIEAQADLSHLGLNLLLKNLFDSLAKSIKKLKKTTYQSQYKKLLDINTHLNTIVSGINFDTISRILQPILDRVPTPVITDRNGNQLGVYRTTSLVFMFDHLIKRYKTNNELETQLKENSSYTPIRFRTNIFVDHPELLSKGFNNNYESNIAIPLTMGSEDNNLEARKQPEFILDLHAFVGEYMSLMADPKNAMLAFQLGTYSDKSTLPQLVTNMTESIGKETIIEILKNGSQIAQLLFVYESANKLDLVHHILYTYQLIFKELKENYQNYQYKGSEDTQKLIESILQYVDIKSILQQVDLKSILQKINPKLITPQIDLDSILQQVDPKLIIQQIDPKLIIPQVDRFLNLDLTSQLYSKEYSDLFNVWAKANKGYRSSKKINSALSKLILSIKEQLDNGIKILNTILNQIPASQNKALEQEIYCQAASRLHIKYVPILFNDIYSKGIEPDGTNKKAVEFNHMVQADLDKAVVKQTIDYNTLLKWLFDQAPTEEELSTLENYNLSMIYSALNKSYFIDGVEMRFIEYLKLYFIKNEALFTKLFKQSTIFKNLNLTGLGSKQSSAELVLISLYGNYLMMTNFLRHLALDLSVKEPYVDKGANENITTERSNRSQTTTKRNNTFTASITAFLMGIPEGISYKTKVCVIEDVLGGVFNTIGADRQVDEWDGLGWNHPIQVRMEDASLRKKHRVSTKKTFITPVSDYSAEELKWASNEITNQIIRESLGYELNMLSIFKRMSSIPFDWNITKMWNPQLNNNNQINIELFLGKKLFVKEGFDYFQIKSIQYTGPNTYKIVKQKVDRYGKIELNEQKTGAVPSETEIKTITTIYDIYETLGGPFSMTLQNGKLDYSEDIMDCLYKIVINSGEIIDDKTELLTQSAIKQPLRNAMIGILATHSSNKRGACNIVTGEAWTNPNIPLSYSEMELNCGGEQLDAEHESDESHITKGTQLLQDLALKGYTSKIITKVYEAISDNMEISSEEFNEVSQLLKAGDIEKLSVKISEKIVKGLELDGNNPEIQTLIAAFQEEAKELGLPFILPLSLITPNVIKSIATELNKDVIKQLDSGLMGTLNGSSGFVQLYNINGLSYSFDNLTSEKWFELFEQKGIRDHIIEFATTAIDQETGKRTIDNKKLFDCVKALTIAYINLGETQFNAIQTYIQNYYKELNKNGENPTMQFIELVAHKNPGSLFALATAYLAINSNETKFLSLEKKAVTQVAPEDWVAYLDENNLLQYLKIDSSEEKLKKIRHLDYVFVDYNRSVDLRPNVTEITTEDGQIHNEYTTEEVLYGETLNAEGITQEDAQNFRNHVKCFGYDLKPVTFINGIPDWKSHFGDFDVTKQFEMLMQSKIIYETILQENIDSEGKPIYICRPGMYNIVKDALEFYIKHKANTYKQEYLTNIVNNPLLVAKLCAENPLFIFTLVLHIDPQEAYKQYFQSHPELFRKIVNIKTNTAQLIMPPIYRGQMHLAGVDLIDVDPNFFTKVPTYYSLPLSLFGKIEDRNITYVKSDFVIRTFLGQYSILVIDDFTNIDSEKYQEVLFEENIKRDEQGYRVVGKRNRQLYKLPDAADYCIARDKLGHEIIFIRNNDNVYSNIKELIASDRSMVTVQPFVTNLILLRNKDGMQNMINLLRDLKTINTIPTFNDTYDKLINIYSSNTPQQLYEKQLPNILAITLLDYTNKSEDYEQRYKKAQYVSFLRSLDIIATRIPTQNMSSIMTMKVSAFLQSDVNNVFVTKWQQWLLGSDYDIDKAFLLGYNFDDNGKFITWSPLQKSYDNELFKESLKIPKPNSKSIEIQIVPENQEDKLLEKFITEYCVAYDQNFDNIELMNLYDITVTEDQLVNRDLLQTVLLTKILDRINEIKGIFITNANVSTSGYDNLIQLIQRHNQYKPTSEGLKNYMTYWMHEIINDPRNATTAYKSIDIATDAFKNPIKELPFHVTYNFDDGHSISSITASGAVGKDDVGIGANGTKATFTILNYLNRNFIENPPLDLNELTDNSYFLVRQLVLNYTNSDEKQVNYTKFVGPISDTQLTDYQRQLYRDYIADNFGELTDLYLYDKDASLDVGALLSMAADNAKDLSLDKMHAETDYFAMHIYLAMIGIPPQVIIEYFTSPEFKSIILNKKNDLANNSKEIISATTFKSNPTMREIYLAAKEITNLSLILSINQGIKVEESEILSIKLKMTNVFRDIKRARNISLNKTRFTSDDIKSLGIVVYDDITQQEIKFIDSKITQMRMKKANDLMDANHVNLNDEFDFNKFLNDEGYRATIIAIYDVLKYNYNIFDIVTLAPHFNAMLYKYNEVLEIYTKVDKQLNFELNQAPKLYNSDIIDNTKPNPSSEFDTIYIPLNLSKTQLKSVKGYFYDAVFFKFLQDIFGPNASFIYQDLNTRTKEKMECEFNTDNALHIFTDFVSFVLIPKLLEQDSKNEFLNNLEFNKVDFKKNGNIFYGFNENLKTMGTKGGLGASKLLSIQQGFDAIKDIPLTQLFGNTIRIVNPNITVGDFLFAYSKLIKMVNPRINEFDTLFSNMNKAGTMKMAYAKFVKDVDLNKIEIPFDLKAFMAYLYRFKIFYTSKDSGITEVREMKFVDQDLSKFFISKREEIGGEKITYTRFLFSAPMEFESEKLNSVILAELLRYAILNGALKITNININCE